MKNSVIVYRQHSLVKVKRHPLRKFKIPKEWPPIESSQVAGSQDISHPHGKELRTTLIALAFEHSENNVVLETLDSECPFIKMAEPLLQLYGVHDKPGNTKDRPKRKRDDLGGGLYKDGRRSPPKKVVLVFHDLESSLGRLFRNNAQFRKAVRAGEPGVHVLVGEYDLEIAKLVPGGSGCSFEIYVRKVIDGDKRIVRLVGKNIKGYLDNKPKENAKALLTRTVTVTISEELKHRQWGSLSQQERELLKSYVADQADLARDLYENLLSWMQSIDPHIIRRDGTLPPSGAGAAVKIAFSMVDPETIPGDGWDRPSDRVTQMGALSYAGGRSFMHVKPGYYENLYLYDGKSWHGHIMTQLPDPATCDYIDIPPGAFRIDQWIGQFGCMCISGVVHDHMNSPIRDHDIERKRLRYHQGAFTRVWAPLPDIVIGVVSGRLTVTHIHDGIHIVGSKEHSFLRKFALTMEEIKKTAVEGSPLYILAKSLTNYVPGKLVEIIAHHPYVNPRDRKILVPIDAPKHYEKLINAYISSRDDLLDMAQELFTQSRHPDDEITFGTLLNRHLPTHATTGAYYLPMHGSQIWGMSSALLGLAATCTHAISGYTDSLITIGNASEGLAQFRTLVQEAGYEAPESGFGSFQPKIKNGHGWMVKAGLWAIRYQDIDRETGEVTIKQKEAIHGLPDLGDKDKWEILQYIAEHKHYTYTSKARPATLIESYQQKIEPGTFLSQEMTLSTGSTETPTIGEIERSQRLLQEANSMLAYASQQDVPTTQSPKGCIDILSGYGLTHSDIAKTTEISLNTIHNIASGRTQGHMHLGKLQQAVDRWEQSRVG